MRFFILALMMVAPVAQAETVIVSCQFDTACGSTGACSPQELALDVVRDDTFALKLRGPDAQVRVRRAESGPLVIFSGTGYEPADTGEEGGFTSLVVHENGDAVILSAVALPLGGGTMETGQFHGRCEEVEN